jgi:gluconate 2-dehydrogenase gamma chain
MSALPTRVRLDVMTVSHLTRRAFLADVGRAATAGGLALQLQWLVALTGCAREHGQFERLTSDEARAMRAFAARIIPSEDGAPGAEEAGAVYFVDRALGMPLYADRLPVIRAGLADLDVRARAIHAGAGFASLSVAQQIAVMRQIERDRFFVTARDLVVIGTFADPRYGGNRGEIGWTMIGIDHRPSYAAPFGWYDAQSDAQAAKGVA